MSPSSSRCRRRCGDTRGTGGAYMPCGAPGGACHKHCLHVAAAWAPGCTRLAAVLVRNGWWPLSEARLFGPAGCATGALTIHSGGAGVYEGVALLAIQAEAPPRGGARARRGRKAQPIGPSHSVRGVGARADRAAAAALQAGGADGGAGKKAAGSSAVRARCRCVPRKTKSEAQAAARGGRAHARARWSGAACSRRGPIEARRARGGGRSARNWHVQTASRGGLVAAWGLIQIGRPAGRPRAAGGSNAGAGGVSGVEAYTQKRTAGLVPPTARRCGRAAPWPRGAAAAGPPAPGAGARAVQRRGGALGRGGRPAEKESCRPGPRA